MLPKQSITMYELEVPSSGQKVKYRAFTIREEKLLLIAQHSEDEKIMVQTLKEIIKSCTNDKLDVDSLAIFDLEYIMVSLRAKSVGETIRLEFQCDNDEKHPITTIDFDLSKITVKKTEGHTNIIPLFDDVGVKMRYPDISMMETLVQIEDDPNMIFGIIYDCIEYIYDSEEIFLASDQTEADLVSFVDSLTKEQFKKIEEFFVTMPKFSQSIEYTCTECGHKHSKNIEGFSNFF